MPSRPAFGVPALTTAGRVRARYPTQRASETRSFRGAGERQVQGAQGEQRHDGGRQRQPSGGSQQPDEAGGGCQGRHGGAHRQVRQAQRGQPLVGVGAVRGEQRLAAQRPPGQGDHRVEPVMSSGAMAASGWTPAARHASAVAASPPPSRWLPTSPRNMPGGMRFHGRKARNAAARISPIVASQGSPSQPPSRAYAPPAASPCRLEMARGHRFGVEHVARLAGGESEHADRLGGQPQRHGRQHRDRADGPGVRDPEQGVGAGVGHQPRAVVRGDRVDVGVDQPAGDAARLARRPVLVAEVGVRGHLVGVDVGVDRGDVRVADGPGRWRR